jgi:hypothetical protein
MNSMSEKVESEQAVRVGSCRFPAAMLSIYLTLRMVSSVLTNLSRRRYGSGVSIGDLIDGRLTRATEQLALLHSEIDRFLERDPFTPEHDVQAGEKRAVGSELVVTVKVREQPDPAWSLLISEIVHHLHTSLDHMAWAVASVSDAPPRGTGFPIFPSRVSYRNQWTRSSGYYATRGMPLQAQAIIEDVQPYHRGNHEGHPLWVLRRLSNEDKHEAPHLVGSSLAVTEHELQVFKGTLPATTEPEFFTGPFKDGDVIARWRLPPVAGPDTKIQTGLRFGFDVAFDKGGPGNGRLARRALSDIAEQVDLIFERLLPFF